MEEKINAKVVFFTKYSRNGASSRYRVYQFVPFFKKSGIKCKIIPFHSKEYLSCIYNHKRISRFYYLKRILKRLFDVMRCSIDNNIDVVFIQKDLLPGSPPFLEIIFKKIGKKIIFDLDDATWIGENNKIFKMSNKLPGVMENSKMVFVGNKYLYEYSSKYNKYTFIIPTTVDTLLYPLRKRNQKNKKGIILGWIGTPITASTYLTIISGAINTLAKKYNITLKLIGVEDASGYGFSCNVISVPWFEETEILELSTIDLGLMPLSDDPFSRGKCGLKLLQYMAMGIPSVASPVGVNKEIIKDGENGFLASSQDEWINKISLLIEDRKLYNTISKNARRTVEENYSLEKWAGKMIELVRNFTGGGN